MRASRKTNFQHLRKRSSVGRVVEVEGGTEERLASSHTVNKQNARDGSVPLFGVKKLTL